MKNHLLRHAQLDCDTFANILDRQGITIYGERNLSGDVPHSGYGGVTMYTYVSPNTGRFVYVLERSGLYAPDAYLCNVWQFSYPFSVSDANDFLTNIDNNHN